MRPLTILEIVNRLFDLTINADNPRIVLLGTYEYYQLRTKMEENDRGLTIIVGKTENEEGTRLEVQWNHFVKSDLRVF